MDVRVTDAIEMDVRVTDRHPVGEGPLGKVVGPGPGPVPPPCLGVNVSFSDSVFLEFFRSQVSLSQ
jgi:hypothetical protein